MKWEEPPAPRRGAQQSGEHKRIAASLRSRPGKWARIAEYPAPHSAYAFANRVRQGKLSSFRPAGAFEARAAASDSGGTVWVRYVGGETAP